MTLPLDPFQRAQIPAELQKRLDRKAARKAADEAAEAEREQHAQWFAEVADGLLRDKPISAEARLYVGGANRAWLDDGSRGDLVRDYLHLRPMQGSHRTAAKLLRRLRELDPPSSG